MAAPVRINALSTTLKSAGNSQMVSVSMIHILNPAAATSYVQFFDAANASDVTLGTTLPTWVIGVPTLQTMSVPINPPVQFLNGLQLAATTTATGSSAPATALDVALVI